jgi:S-adenosylmethionine hydrolase
MRDPAIITLTTDFGLADAYAGAMEGVILSINPRAAIVDISHDVRPQSILQACFVTQSAWPYFPDGCVHVAVVDPGVGSDRRALAVETPRGLFVGPDNGVLSSALPREARPPELAEIALPAGYRAFAITNPAYMRSEVSATFHGRDIFAPAAAHLSLGVEPDVLGEPVERVLSHPPLRARRRADGSLEARVLHIDRFGNVISDARREDLPEGRLAVEIAGPRIEGLTRTYADATGLAAIIGSAGYLEIALPRGSAADALGVNIGDAVLVRPRG